MIRFIDIGDQILDESSQFSFYDTVVDVFVGWEQNYVWDTWGEFEEDFRLFGGWREMSLDRFKFRRALERLR